MTPNPTFERTLLSVAIACALAPVAARAQDATALVVFIAPPFLLVPAIAAVIRHRWLGHLNRTPPSLRNFLALGTLEFLLWLLAAWFAAVVYFQEGWGAALALGAVIAAILALDRRIGAPHTSWLFTLAFMAVFPGAWVIVQPLWYWFILLWERFAA